MKLIGDTNKDKNLVTFYTVVQGTKVIVLEAKLSSSNDMPRLWQLAKVQLEQLSFVMKLAA